MGEDYQIFIKIILQNLEQGCKRYANFCCCCYFVCLLFFNWLNIFFPLLYFTGVYLHVLIYLLVFVLFCFVFAHFNP